MFSLGDIEAVYDLPTYSTTYRCIQAITLYELDIPSFIRLIIKKNPDTFETMRRIAEAKIRYRDTSIKGGIPLYEVLLGLIENRTAGKKALQKLFPRLLVMQAKKDSQKGPRNVTHTIIPDRREEYPRKMSRSQKVFLHHCCCQI